MNVNQGYLEFYFLLDKNFSFDLSTDSLVPRGSDVPAILMTTTRLMMALKVAADLDFRAGARSLVGH